MQLGLSALGEEIAWRAFFQSHVSKQLLPQVTIIGTSIIFALGHAIAGSFGVVVYDLIFIFMNSCIYGWIFYKTNSVWVSILAHLLANVFAIVILPALL